MDPETEAVILQTIHEIQSDMIIILVTHQASALPYADDIFEISNGSLKPVRSPVSGI